MMNLFKEVLEYNLNLISLNLDFTGLFKSFLYELISNLHLSETLRCIHLSGNIEISEAYKESIMKTLGGVPSKNSTKSNQDENEDGVCSSNIVPYKSAKRHLEMM